MVKFPIFIIISSLALPVLVEARLISPKPAFLDDSPSTVPVYDNPGLAPLLHPAAAADTVSGAYIVVFKDSIDPIQANEHGQWVNRVIERSDESNYLEGSSFTEGIEHIYNASTLFKGYAGKFTSTTLTKIRKSPEVAYIEKDGIVYTSEVERHTPWGLARISNRDPLSLWTFNKYAYDPRGGQGIKIFVIDSGIKTDHVDFEDRADWGISFVKDRDYDDHGHGTHVAGTAAGKRFGVAKQARLVAVKVVNELGTGFVSQIIAGVNWAIEQNKIDAEDARKAGKPYKGAVGNMSLGTSRSRALNEAVNSAVDSGITMVVAAGNDNRNAYFTSPASAEKAITVGASNIKDERASFSNYGKCVDVFAPGKDIMSAWNTDIHSTLIGSGTSMATPHVAGLAAYFLSFEENGGISPMKIKQKIIEVATRGKLKNLPWDTQNILVFNNYTITK